VLCWHLELCSGAIYSYLGADNIIQVDPKVGGCEYADWVQLAADCCVNTAMNFRRLTNDELSDYWFLTKYLVPRNWLRMFLSFARTSFKRDRLVSFSEHDPRETRIVWRSTHCHDNRSSAHARACNFQTKTLPTMRKHNLCEIYKCRRLCLQSTENELAILALGCSFQSWAPTGMLSNGKWGGRNINWKLHLQMFKEFETIFTGIGLQGVEIPIFLGNRFTDGGQIVSLTRRPSYNFQKYSWYSFLLEAK
jgi:hypothetical protein